jgi:hypothetical protein
MALKLNPEPTFKAAVRIPVPGGESEPVVFTFKHRTVDELKEFHASCKAGLPDFDVFRACVLGWDLVDEFNEDNIRRLLQSYHGAAREVAKTYVTELMGARLGN